MQNLMVSTIAVFALLPSSFGLLLGCNTQTRHANAAFMLDGPQRTEVGPRAGKPNSTVRAGACTLISDVTK